LVAAPAKPSGAATRLPRWTTSLTLSGGYDSNVDLLPAHLGREDFSGRLKASVKGHFAPKSWRVALGGDGGILIYRKLSAYNAVPFGGSLSAGGEISRRTRLATELDYRHDYNRNMASFVDAGLVANNLLTSTALATIGLSQQLVHRVSLVADASYRRVSFQDELQPEGDTLSLSARLEWKPAETDRVSMYYVRRRERSRGYAGSNNDETRISWERRLTGTLDTALFAGYGRAQLLDGPRTVTSPSAGARLDGRYGRHQVSGSYEHSLLQAYGLSRSLFFDTVSLNEGYAVTPRWSVFIKGSLSRASDPVDATYRLDGEGVNGTLALRVSPRRTMRASYSYWTRRESGGLAFGSHVLELSLLYERSSEALVREGR
jgi:hypothetical protein